MFARQRLQHFERRLVAARQPMRGSKNQARARMARNGLENLSRLFRGERGIPLEQSRSMPQRNIQCSNGLRSAVQLNIQIDPRRLL